VKIVRSTVRRVRRSRNPPLRERRIGAKMANGAALEPDDIELNRRTSPPHLALLAGEERGEGQVIDRRCYLKLIPRYSATVLTREKYSGWY
jgi:hypothetical protein